ncbi:interferon gamma 1 [Notolabrus celidotus]|uniref:interferon gamma 1 n=1 Tax=Notolabrus celidotus TaxID=1203425 RepID=UPI00148F811B|nr:interferon gamma 1 [Notolabrus celidotus]
MSTTARAVICLTLCLAACQVRGFYVPQEMNRTIQKLLRHYEISDEMRFNGNPVFSRTPLSGKIETKKLFLGAVLETYEKLLEHMIKQRPTPSPQTTGGKVLPNANNAIGAETGSKEDVRGKLNYILNKVQDLRRMRYQQQHELLKSLQTLKHIKMDSLEVQSKALWELSWLYEEASDLSTNAIEQRRRRRQARKTRPRLTGRKQTNNKTG